MAGTDEVQTRTELALWFIDHDEVDEAARVLAVGDELELGRSDYLDSMAALGRRGLTASYDHPHMRVQAPEGLGAEPRKPPARAVSKPRGAAKKTA